MKELHSHFFPNCSYWQVDMNGFGGDVGPNAMSIKKK